MLRHLSICALDGRFHCLRRAPFGFVRFRRQVSLSDDIRGGSSNAPHREEKPRRMTGLKTVMHGATQGSLNPSPTRSHSRANTSKLGRGITLSGMTRFCADRGRAQPPARLAPHNRAGRGAWMIRLLGRSAHQLIENQFAMLLKCAEAFFERM